MDRCSHVSNYGGEIRVWLLFSMRKEVVGGLQKVSHMDVGQNGLPQRPSKVAPHCSLRDTGSLHPNSPQPVFTR